MLVALIRNECDVENNVSLRPPPSKESNAAPRTRESYTCISAATTGLRSRRTPAPQRPVSETTPLFWQHAATDGYPDGRSQCADRRRKANAAPLSRQ